MEVNIDDLIRERRRMTACQRMEEPVEVRHIHEVQGYDRLELTRRFGQQPEEGRNYQCMKPIQEVRTLTEQEKCILQQQDFISHNFCIQFLYKVTGDLPRDIFRENVHNIFRRIPELRVNFVPLGLDHKYHKVVFEDVMPEVNYTSLNCLEGETLDNALQRTMAVDRRHGFDVEKDVLMRILIINTLRKNEYAILLTESRFIADAWNGEDFLSMAWEGLEVAEKGKNTAPPEFSSSSYQHWDSVLANLPPPPSLPGYKGFDMRLDKRSYRVRLNKVDRSLLLTRSKGVRDLIMAILFTAWGLLQKHIERIRETCYCLILPSYSMKLKNAAKLAGIVHPIPMRLSCDEEDELVKDLVMRQLKQMLTAQSMPVSHMKDILTDTGQTLSAFPFFLHFHSFLGEKKGFADVDTKEHGALVDMHSWEAGLENFGLYFDMNNRELSYTIAYNTYCYSPANIEALGRAYDATLHCLLLLWDKEYSLFDEKLKEALRRWDRTYSVYVN